jgi:hypothetical protein
MRGLTHGDVVAVASLLRTRPRETWDATVDRLLDRAHAADAYRKRLGRVHPRWGNGSLMSTVLCESPVWPEQRLSDPRYVEALAAVLLALIHRRRPG